MSSNNTPSVVTLIPTNNTNNTNTSKVLTHSMCNIPEIKESYVSLLNDNLPTLINYIYTNTSKAPYNNPEIRVALSLQMIFSSNVLINPILSSKIAKDINDLKCNNTYLSKWSDRDKKLRTIEKELSRLINNHTEIDDTISLNVSDEDLQRRGDLYSSVSTMLPVSQSVPLKFDQNDQNTCNIS
jgi:hypothetical protein